MMEIRKYTYVDVYYSDEELKNGKGERERKRLEKLGYACEVKDDGNDEFDYCDQYLRYSKTETK